LAKPNTFCCYVRYDSKVLPCNEAFLTFQYYTQDMRELRTKMFRLAKQSLVDYFASPPLNDKLKGKHVKQTNPALHIACKAENTSLIYF
jgi:hypothetical protein